MFVTLNEAEQIIDWIQIDRIPSYRLKICDENRTLIEELRLAIDAYQMANTMLLTWTVIGVITGETAYFIIHCKQSPTKGRGEVIHVNFRSRKVTKRAA